MFLIMVGGMSVERERERERERGREKISKKSLFFPCCMSRGRRGTMLFKTAPFPASPFFNE